MNNLKIRTKMFLIYIICVLIPMVATNYAVLTTVKKNADKQLYASTKEIENRIEYEMELCMNNIILISDYLAMDKELNSFIKKQYPTVTDYYDSFNKLLNSYVIKYYYTAQAVSDVLICTDNETMVSGTYFASKKEVENEVWYHEYEKGGKKMTLVSYYNDNSYEVYTSKARHICVIRPMDYFGGEDVLKVDIEYSDLISSILKENQNTHICITDGERVVFDNNEENFNGDFAPVSTIAQKDIAYQKDMKILNATWNIYVGTDSYHILEGLAGNSRLMILILLLNLILPTILLVIVNHSFKNRIAITQKYIKKVEKEEFELISCQEGKDEIGNLIRSFNTMSAKIKQLIEVVYKKNMEKQAIESSRREAELHALQSQINPHFLFNMLESIRMHSLIKKEEETAMILEQASLLIRESVQWDEEFVKIENEAGYIENYLKIQKYRFGDKLNYQVHVQKECMQKRVPKFSLLTFVENSCVHGMEKNIKQVDIMVVLGVDEGCMSFELMDTGSGMEEKQVEALREKMEHVSMEDLKTSKSIGILNSMIRLKLYFKGEVTFDIESMEGRGTELCVMMPFEEN